MAMKVKIKPLKGENHIGHYYYGSQQQQISNQGGKSYQPQFINLEERRYLLPFQWRVLPVYTLFWIRNIIGKKNY